MCGDWARTISLLVILFRDFDLGRRGVPPREDAEVDPDLETGGLLLDGECDDFFDLH